jgi:hypothetical protein
MGRRPHFSSNTNSCLFSVQEYDAPGQPLVDLSGY